MQGLPDRLTASQRRARGQKEKSVLFVHALAAGSRLNEKRWT